MPPAPLRLTVDTAALAANWRWLSARGGVAAGAAVKADGYGLGAREVVAVLARAGTTEFFVATWAEAAALLPMPPGTRLAVLHGLMPGETPLPGVVPVLNTPAQVARWVAGGGGVCDLMVDTGINRLGLAPADLAGLPAGLAVDVLHSHLACADDPAHPLNRLQLGRFVAARAAVPHRRAALANTAGVCLGSDYAFDLTRPGIGLYGGSYPAAAGGLQPVVSIAARVVQVRDVGIGESFGYGATWTAPRPSRIAVAGIGYADGYRRAFSGVGRADVDGQPCPVIGRVSMDLTGVDVTGHDVAEGDWLRFDFDLAAASAATGIAQYELLTGLGHRYERTFR